jgi:hypothetical protein
MRTIACIALAALGCVGPVKVETEVEPGIDFSRLATFAQAEPPEDDPSRPRYTPEIGLRIQAEIASVLEAKGYEPAPRESADMEVAFVVSGESRSRRVVASDPDANYSVREDYTEGTLVITVFETGTGRLVWRGIGETDMVTSGSLLRSDVERVAVTTVRKVLAEFPRAPAAAGS